ncbi:hypothetical protein D0T92_06220 [Neisseria zalophi]|uniref:RHS repeat protein n=1 Tax=Neisseria zalophi TaxID=640030 RepID=A0A5J6PYC5_9NEIS|nr:hypothetical protein D0T92_06220 [Neisseria zalophi]
MQTAVKRRYGYDKTGNLIHRSDQRSGVTKFEYDKLGRITKADKETFAFDPAHNILSDGQKDKIADNRLKTYNGISYYYDDLGNLIHRELADGEVQNHFYDLHDQLVKVEIFKKDSSKETWVYSYDALGRRTGKGRLKNGQEVSDGLEDKTDFTWDGSHLIQETRSDGLYTYIYTDKDAYEPLAQIRNWTNEEGESYQETNYFHCDQIGIPREMTDKDGNLLWFGKYKGWGKLEEETNISNTHQPFRLQNQYCDTETGLHYNFFRYYEPECGRFVNQDPIGLTGGENFYLFAFNSSYWIDPLGLVKWRGTSNTIGYGFVTNTQFNLQYECVNGKSVSVMVLTLGGTFGIGAGALQSHVEFDDGLSYLDPYALKGLYTDGSGAIAVGKGVSAGSTTIGKAETKGIIGTTTGATATIGSILGFSGVTVVKQSWRGCSKCNIPNIPSGMGMKDIWGMPY